MIVRRKDGGKQIHLSEEEITLEQLKECGNILYTPNIDYVNRNIILSFPHDKTFPSGATREELEIFHKEWSIAREEHIKVYEVLTEMVNKQMTKLVERFGESVLLGEETPKIEGKKLPNMSLTEIFVPSLGKLTIEL